MLSIRNKTLNKKELKELIYCAFLNYGKYKATSLLDGLKNLGFYFATQSGISISIEDLKVPPQKKYILKRARNQILKTNLFYTKGEISEVERFQKVIDTWQLTNENVKDNVVSYFKTHDPLNPIYIMAFSGARGNLSQVRQLVGMRGLMTDPNGQIIDLSINHNFREGLSITDYIISSYGARKGIIDTALKTADSGYLTRRLVDVAQHVIIREIDCNTKRNLRINNIETIKYGLVGRILAKEVIYYPTKKILAKSNQEITDSLVNQFKNYYIRRLNIRSPLTCESSRSICQKCYGWNLAQVNIVSLGESIGVIAAQSIGEPGTQLTMRTFHTGGVATNDVNHEIRSRQAGQVFFSTNLIVQPSRTMYGEKIYIVENNSQIYLLNTKLILQKIDLIPGLILFVTNKGTVKKNQKIAEFPILTNQAIIATKKITSNQSGEIFFQKLGFKLTKKQHLQITNSGLVWLLKGDSMSVKTNSCLLFKVNQTFRPNEILFQTKITNHQRGVVKIRKKASLNKENYQKYQIFNPVTLFNVSIGGKTTNENLLFTSTNEIYQFKVNLNQSILTSINLAKLQASNNSLFFGSQIFYSILKRKKLTNLNKNNVKILFLPEEHFILNKVNKLIKLNSYERIRKGIELTGDIFASQDGIIFLKKQEGVLNKLVFQAGIVQNFNNRLSWQIHSKVIYPGERVLNLPQNLRLTYAQVYTEIKKHDKFENETNLILRPIIQNHILRRTNIKQLKFTPATNQCKIQTNRYLNFINGSWVNAKLSQKKELFGQFLQLKQKKDQISVYKIGFVTLAKIDTFRKRNKSYETTTRIYLTEKTTVNLTNEDKYKVNVNTLNNQIVEPYTILSYYNSTEAKKLNILNYKNREDNPYQIFYTNPSDYISYKFVNTKDGQNHITRIVKQSRFVTKKDYISNSGLTNSAGYIIGLKKIDRSTKMTIRLGQPYFISKGSILYVKNSTFIKENNELGLLIYERIITGDIVQGLPRIEQIVEARTSTEINGIIEKFGVLVGRTKGDWFNILDKTNKRKYNTFLNQNKKTTLKIGELVKVGTPYIMGKINPKHLLQVFFEHYYSLYSLYDSTFRAIIQVQFVLINSIQTVYRNQGIEISSKHIELIIKQMTSKVSIFIEKNRLQNRYNNYDNILLFQQMVGLQQVNYINQALIITNKPILLYKPTLLGVTKVALLTESFLSSSSFQGTRTILIQAAIEGRMDWLRGLKENVILGNLLPAGTGFNNLTLTSNIKIKISVPE
tara:strand:- start:4744 stop:8493 length:3750 start_codon:yes stop_codon:yes gene_type:complete